MKKREYLVALCATVFLMIVIDRLCLIFEVYYWISQSFWRTGIFRWYDQFFPVHTLIYAIISSYLGIFLTFFSK